MRIDLLAVAFVLTALDLGTKYAAEHGLTGSIVGLSLRLTYNPGIAFSLGTALPSWVIVGITGLITLAIVVYAWRTAPTTLLPGRVGLAAVLAGALGNLLDRAGDGVVTDYLHTGWFPTFNLADTLITCGAALLLLTTLRPARTRT